MSQVTTRKIEPNQVEFHLAYLFSNRGVKTLLIVKCERENRIKSIYKAIPGGELRKSDLR